jgi:Tfp pilus assembly protein PilV
MTKWIIGLLAAAVLALPATAFGDTGGQSQTKSPAQQCRAERSANPTGFKEKYGTNHNKSNAFGKCVSKKAKEQAAGEDNGSDRSNAAELCRAERSKDAAAFKEKWGTNHNKSNAFGKCVSQKAKERSTS